MTRLINWQRVVMSLCMYCLCAGHLYASKKDTLTYDKPLQALAEKLLNNKQGSIIAINPANGEVLCMVTNNKIDDSVDRAVAIDYSPGSTFKTAQTAALLSLHAVTTDQTYTCKKGFWQKNIHIGCHPHPAPLDLVHALGISCNSYYCKVFKDFVDNRTLYPAKATAMNDWNRVMQSMGLGRKLGIDLPGELPGLIPDAAYLDKTHRNSWNGTTIMWMGMGQGEVRTTPLQLCNLAAVIANRGTWYVPHVHRGTMHKPLDTLYTTMQKAIPDSAAFNIVVEGMRISVTDPNGTCRSIRNANYKACGKTGTAENEGHDHSVFIGFAPEHNPKIAVSVYVENGGWGADLAAPLGGLIMEKYIMKELSPASQKKVDKWKGKEIKVTPVEVPINLDDL